LERKQQKGKNGDEVFHKTKLRLYNDPVSIAYLTCLFRELTQLLSKGLKYLKLYLSHMLRQLTQI